MNRNNQVLCYITIIVVALSVTAVLYMLMPVCPDCGRRFCFGDCEGYQQGGDSGTPGQGLFRPAAPKSNQTTTRLSETERQSEDYLERITFIGDSRTVALTAQGISEERIFAENGLNHIHALDQKVVRLHGSEAMTIPEAVALTTPEIMLVNFGINGAVYMEKQEFLEGYGRMIDALLESSPESILIIESILPVASFYEMDPEGVSNEKIDDLNAGLYQLAQDKGVYYMATGESMKDAENNLISSYTADGLHYNREGCQAILDYVLTHAVLEE